MSSWSNRFVSVGALALLAACHSAPPKPAHATAPDETRAPAAAAGAPAAGTPAAGAASANVPAAGAAAGAAGSAATPVQAAPIPERATQQYAQALQLMKSGRTTDAELELKQLVAGYPQLTGPQLNLGLLYLHDSRLPEAEAAFKAALALIAVQRRGRK